MGSHVTDEFGRTKLAPRYDDADYEGPKPPHSGFIEGCPECGGSVPAGEALAHARTHWEDQISDDPRHAEAIRRRAYLLKFDG